MTDMLTKFCNEIWHTGEWPTPWKQSLIITLTKKGNLQLCQNHTTISLISHASKVMLKIIPNRLKPQAEEIIAEEQAGFRCGRSTTEQIFNIRVQCEKYSQRQQDSYHIFIDIKKAFDRVWIDTLWATMNRYHMNQKLINTSNSCSAVLVQDTMGDWFHASVGVRQGCLLSPTSFNIVLKRIMTDAREEHHGTVGIGGRIITNLRFDDDIDGLAGEEQELANLVNRLDKTSSRHGMEISAEKAKLMTNSTKQTEKITVSGQELEIVNQFKCLGAILSEEGSKTEVLPRAALAKLKPV